MATKNTIGMQKFARRFYDSQRISNTEPHLRWNREVSPDDPEKARYHFVIVANRYREITRDKLVEKISHAGAIRVTITPVRTEKEGKVANSRMRWLFCTYDSELDISGFLGINMPVLRDHELRERKTGSIENYVKETYFPTSP